MSRILIAGESWLTTTTHAKGVDEFTVHSYTEGVGPLRDALIAGRHEVTHLPAHLVPTQFPDSDAALSEYDVIILSDIGANSLQLAPGVFEQGRPGVDRIAELTAWVERGGSLLMIGGYLSFSGFQARAAYQRTDLTRVLPVQLLEGDDRVERPGGIKPVVTVPDHPALGTTGTDWPLLLGYNKTVLKKGATQLAQVGDDPLIALGTFGAGRSAVFTSDCSPHWAPAEFCLEWAGYSELFNGLVAWLTER